jgi:hypothetical protein
VSGSRVWSEDEWLLTMMVSLVIEVVGGSGGHGAGTVGVSQSFHVRRVTGQEGKIRLRRRRPF